MERTTKEDNLTMMRLGVPIETADLDYSFDLVKMPCWSLSALMDLFPSDMGFRLECVNGEFGKWQASVEVNGSIYCAVNNTRIGSIINLLEMVIGEGLLYPRQSVSVGAEVTDEDIMAIAKICTELTKINSSYRKETDYTYQQVIDDFREYKRQQRENIGK